MAAASDNHEVKLFSFPSMQLQRVLTRMTGAIHSIQFNHDDSILAVAGEYAISIIIPNTITITITITVATFFSLVT